MCLKSCLFSHVFLLIIIIIIKSLVSLTMVAERGLKTLDIAQDLCISSGKRSLVEGENKSKEISGQWMDWD